MIQVKNAVICDGTGKEPFSGELLIDGEKLAEVSPIPFGELDAEVLDARGIRGLSTPTAIVILRHFMTRSSAGWSLPRASPLL